MMLKPWLIEENIINNDAPPASNYFTHWLGTHWLGTGILFEKHGTSEAREQVWNNLMYFNVICTTVWDHWPEVSSSNKRLMKKHECLFIFYMTDLNTKQAYML